MTRCLFCGAYCEGYPDSRGEKERKQNAEVLGCTQLAHPISAITALRTSKKL